MSGGGRLQGGEPQERRSVRPRRQQRGERWSHIAVIWSQIWSHWVITTGLIDYKDIVEKHTQQGIVISNFTGTGKSMLPRFCEHEVKQLRSSACSRLENAIVSLHIHPTDGRKYLLRPQYKAAGLVHQ